VLAVVQQQQQLSVPHHVHEPAGEPTAGHVSNVERTGDLPDDEGRVVDGRQVCECLAIGERPPQIRGGADRQPGLAHPGRP
jgi:hypothetical protein